MLLGLMSLEVESAVALFSMASASSTKWPCSQNKNTDRRYKNSSCLITKAIFSTSPLLIRFLTTVCSPCWRLYMSKNSANLAKSFSSRPRTYKRKQHVWFSIVTTWKTWKGALNVNSQQRENAASQWSVHFSPWGPAASAVYLPPGIPKLGGRYLS